MSVGTQKSVVRNPHLKVEAPRAPLSQLTTAKLPKLVVTQFSGK